MLPPGPSSPAAVQTLAWFTRPVPWLLGARERYGDVFTIQLLGEEVRWLMLADPAHVKEVFTAPPDVLRAGEANAILRPVLGDRSVLLLDGPEHMRERKLMLPAFHGARMQRYGTLMNDIAEAEIATWPHGEPLALAPRMQAMTLEVILRAVFGVRNAERLDALRSALVAFLATVTTPLAFFGFVTLGDRARAMPVFRRRLAEVDALLHAEIAAHRRAEDLAERDDILSLLCLATDEDGAPMSDAQLRDELITLLLAGHETTATGLSWAIERLVRTPGAWARLREEAREGGDAFALAVAHETLRLRPVIPLVLRRLTEPMTIAGIDLPAGAKVAPSIVMVHRNEAVYADPHAFRPERFLEKAPGTYTWIPFGGGVRRCLGAAFALYEMQVVLQAIARNTSLEAVDGADEGVRRRAITFTPAHGATVRVAA